MSEGPLLPLWGVIIGLALIIINAWFAAARKSISESNRTKLRELADDGNRKAKAALLSGVYGNDRNSALSEVRCYVGIGNSSDYRSISHRVHHFPDTAYGAR